MVMADAIHDGMSVEFVDDMRQRDAEGRRKYDTPLQAFNGRRPLVDAYQEALDLVVYLRQAVEEGRDDLAPMYREARALAHRLRHAAQGEPAPIRVSEPRRSALLDSVAPAYVPKVGDRVEVVQVDTVIHTDEYVKRDTGAVGTVTSMSAKEHAWVSFADGGRVLALEVRPTSDEPLGAQLLPGASRFCERDVLDGDGKRTGSCDRPREHTGVCWHDEPGEVGGHG